MKVVCTNGREIYRMIHAEELESGFQRILTLPMKGAIDMSDMSNQWSEGDSEIFIDLGEIFVPGRAEQMAAMLDLIPGREDEQLSLIHI